MTERQIEYSASLADRVDTYICAMPKLLTFDAELEAMFQRRRAKTRATHGYWASLAAILVYNVALTANLLCGEIDPAAAPRVLLAAQAVITAPFVVLLIFLRRNRNPLRHDLILLAACAFVVAGSLLINRNMIAESRAYDMMTLVLIPVTCNIVVPLSFWAAAAGTVACVGVLTANSLLSADFAPETQSTMILLYVLGATLTLVANYRLEHAERVQHLHFLRESLRNQTIVRANDELAAISRTDALTHLANRRAFDERFAEAFETCGAEKRPLSVIIADIDQFKAYNDRWGHPEGDKCLRIVAAAIASAIDERQGFVGRYGGEEFAVVLFGAGSPAAGAIAERIRSAVAALALPHPAGGKTGVVTLSLGAASLNPACPEDAAALLQRADEALYRAKRNGRDRAEIDLRVVNG